MKKIALALLLLPLAFVFSVAPAPAPQSRPRVVVPKDAGPIRGDEEVVKTDVDLVVFDAIVLQKKTGASSADSAAKTSRSPKTESRSR